MPEGNPLIGEVWEMQDPFAGSIRPAVIVSRLEGSSAFQLVGRAGRILNVPARSMNLLWKFVRAAQEGTRCSIRGCMDLACLRTIDGRWFCAPHFPRNQPALLPGDTVDEAHQTLDNAFDACPLCNAKRSNDATWQIIEDTTVYRCTCLGYWIQITAQGLPEDGINMAEDLQEAYDILESRLSTRVQVRIGATALTTLARSFKEINRSDPSFAGIKLTPSDKCPTNSILLVGTPAQTRATREPVALPQPVDLTIGDEYEQNDSERIFRIDAFTSLEVRLLGDDSKVLTVRMPAFRSAYRRIVRRSATDRLLGDDDLI